LRIIKTDDGTQEEGNKQMAIYSGYKPKVNSSLVEIK